MKTFITLALLGLLCGAASATVSRSDRLCVEGMYMCLDNLCIPDVFLCDGVYDCTTMDDEANCDVTCSEFQYQCDDQLCIPQESVCNGIDDCSTGDDEQDCGYSTESEMVEESSSDLRCVYGYFRCDNGHCIPGEFLCNGVRDCINGIDEKDCDSTKLEKVEESSSDLRCMYGYFRCDNGHCIPGEFRCNGVRDCSNGTDEKDCDSTKLEKVEESSSDCVDGYFRCDNGRCIPEDLLCNGVWNCITGSDEKDCDARDQ